MGAMVRITSGTARSIRRAGHLAVGPWALQGIATSMRVYDSLTQTVGNTPLVRLREVTRDLKLSGPGPDVLAKVEYFNPGGSVKDRIALRMIQTAAKTGVLPPGGTVV